MYMITVSIFVIYSETSDSGPSEIDKELHLYVPQHLFEAFFRDFTVRVVIKKITHHYTYAHHLPNNNQNHTNMYNFQ